MCIDLLAVAGEGHWYEIFVLARRMKLVWPFSCISEKAISTTLLY